MAQLLSPEARQQVPPNLKTKSLSRSQLKNFYRLSVIVEDAPADSISVLNTYHSIALSHTVRVWQRAFTDMKPGVSNAYLNHVNHVTDRAVDSAEKLIK